MVLKRIFLILILPIFIYAQWTDPRPRSVQLWHMAEGVIDSLTVSAFYSDTLEAKETSLSENVGGLIRLNGLASGSNYGAGLFLITNTSYTPDGANVINLNSGSNQLVRLNDPIVKDTTALKNLPPVWRVVNLKQLSSDNIGGGDFVRVDSVFREGYYHSYNSSVLGEQWVRPEYLADSTTVYGSWAGLKADGTTDQQATLVKLKNIGSGKKFIINTPGVILTDTLRLDVANQIWEFGERTSLKAKAPTAYCVRIVTNNITMRGLEIDGNAANQSGAAPGIRVDHIDAYPDSVYNITIENSRVTNTKGNAILLNGGSNAVATLASNITLEKVKIDSVRSYAIYCNWEHANLKLIDVEVDSCKENAMFLGNEVSDISIQRFKGKRIGRMALEVYSVSDNLHVDDFTATDFTASAIRGISVAGTQRTNMSNITITDLGSTGDGIEIVDAKIANLTNFNIRNVKNGMSVETNERVNISNGNISITTEDGLRLSNGTNFTKITDVNFNAIASTASGISIEVSDTSNSVIIKGCTFDSSGTAIGWGNGRVKNFIAEANIATNPIKDKTQFLLTGMINAVIKGNIIDQPDTTSTGNGMSFSTGKNLIVIGNYVYGFKGSGAKGYTVGATVTNATFIGNIAQKCATGFDLAPADSLTNLGNYSY